MNLIKDGIRKLDRKNGNKYMKEFFCIRLIAENGKNNVSEISYRKLTQ